MPALEFFYSETLLYTKYFVKYSIWEKFFFVQKSYCPWSLSQQMAVAIKCQLYQKWEKIPIPLSGEIKRKRLGWLW